MKKPRKSKRIGDAGWVPYGSWDGDLDWLPWLDVGAWHTVWRAGLGGGYWDRYDWGNGLIADYDGAGVRHWRTPVEYISERDPLTWESERSAAMAAAREIRQSAWASNREEVFDGEE